MVDLVGFWVVWHLEGGFEGLQGMGMSRASIYRRIKLFRIAVGAHPDEFVMPGVTLDLAAYREVGGKGGGGGHGRGGVAGLRLSVRPRRHSLVNETAQGAVVGAVALPGCG